MSIDFGNACRALFVTEKKWMTVLGLLVGLFIPVAGPMVTTGYLARRFMRERQGHPPEDFDFSFFAEYLKIGLWPVLAICVLSLICIPIVMLPAALVVFAVFQWETSPELSATLVIIGTLLYIATITLMNLVIHTITIRSSLQMDFKAAFSWSFIREFLGTVGWSLLGYYILLMLVATPLVFVGYLALFIGVYAVGVWMQFVLMHLVFQHYDLYLARGGAAIEVNPELTREFVRVSPPPALPPGTGR